MYVEFIIYREELLVLGVFQRFITIKQKCCFYECFKTFIRTKKTAKMAVSQFYDFFYLTLTHAAGNELELKLSSPHLGFKICLVLIRTKYCRVSGRKQFTIASVEGRMRSWKRSAARCLWKWKAKQSSTKPNELLEPLQKPISDAQMHKHTHTHTHEHTNTHTHSLTHTHAFVRAFSQHK